MVTLIFIFLKILFIYLLLEGGEGREKKGKKHQCEVVSHTSPTGDLFCNPGMHPNWELNLRSFGSQAGTQSIEPQQTGLYGHI